MVAAALRASLRRPRTTDDKNKDAEKSAKEAQAPANTSGGKARTKTWPKGNVWDKLRNRVMCDKATYDQLREEVPNYKRITPAVVSETEDP